MMIDVYNRKVYRYDGFLEHFLEQLAGIKSCLYAFTYHCTYCVRYLYTFLENIQMVDTFDPGYCSAIKRMAPCPLLSEVRERHTWHLRNK